MNRALSLGEPMPKFFLGYRLSFFLQDFFSSGFFSGLPLGKPLPGIFALSFIDNFPFIQSHFRGPQIPEIKEFPRASPPGPPPRLCPGPAAPSTPGQISGFSVLPTFIHVFNQGRRDIVLT